RLLEALVADLLNVFATDDPASRRTHFLPYPSMRALRPQLLGELTLNTSPTMAIITMRPPTQVGSDGTSANASHTHTADKGVSSLAISAERVAETIRVPIMRRSKPRPNWMVPKSIR